MHHINVGFKLGTFFFDSNDEAINAANSINIQKISTIRRSIVPEQTKIFRKTDVVKCFVDIVQKLSLQSFTKYVETNL